METKKDTSIKAVKNGMNGLFEMERNLKDDKQTQEYKERERLRAEYEKERSKKVNE